MHKNIHVHLYRITIEHTRTLLYNTVRNKENNKHRKEVKKYEENKKYDLCVLLGDHYDRDIGIILRYVDYTQQIRFLMDSILLVS